MTSQTQGLREVSHGSSDKSPDVATAGSAA